MVAQAPAVAQKGDPEHVSTSYVVFVVGVLTLLCALTITTLGFSVVTAARGDDINAFTRTPIQNIIEVGGRYSAFFMVWIFIYMGIRKKRRGWLLFIPYPLAWYYLLDNPQTVPRTLTAAYAIVLVICFAPLDKVRYKLGAVFSYAALLSGLMPLLNQLSRGSRGGRLFVSPADYFSQSGDLDGFQSTINVFMWIDNTGIKLGKQIASALLVFIPRPVWPDKAIATGSNAAAFAGYSFVNVSAPLPAEIFADFGWIGLVFGGLAFGYLMSKADALAADMRSRGNVGHLLPFATAAAFSGIVIRGSLIGVLAFVIYAVILAILVQSIEKMRPKAAGNASVKKMRRSNINHLSAQK